jgi:hypothetical protein
VKIVKVRLRQPELHPVIVDQQDFSRHDLQRDRPPGHPWRRKAKLSCE